MSSSQTELESACEAGNLSRVRDLYGSISSPVSKHDILATMILTAAENNHPDVVRFCLDQGAEASHEVITEAYDLPDIAKVLITSGAMDVNYDYEMAGDLLINAVYARQVSHPRNSSEFCVGIDESRRQGKGAKKGKPRYKCHQLLANSLLFQKYQYDYVQWLLSHGADPNSGHLMTDSTSALTAATTLGLYDHTTLLISYGAALSGRGAAAAAAANGHTELLRYLITQGADINEVGVRDFGDRRKIGEEGTPLHNAATRGDLEMARMLVGMGARIDLRDRLGRTPWDRAKQAGMDEVSRFLEQVMKSGYGGNGSGQ